MDGSKKINARLSAEDEARYNDITGKTRWGDSTLIRNALFALSELSVEQLFELSSRKEKANAEFHFPTK